MKKFYYIRDFSTDLHFDNVSIVERLLLSATLTKFMEKDERDSADIIFETVKDVGHAYRNWISYRDFVHADDKIKQSKRCFLYDTVIKMAETDPKTLHYIKLDITDLNISGRNSLATIAWKAFAVAASQHSVNDNNDWFDLSAYEWKRTAALQFKRTMKEIEDFLAEHDIYARLIGKSTVRIFSKKAQEAARKKGGPHLIRSDAAMVVETASIDEQPKQEPSKAEELFDDEELTAEEKAAEEEWLAAESGAKEEEPVEEAEEVEEATSSDTLTPEQWVEWYYKKESEYEQAGKHREWVSKLRLCGDAFNLNAAKERLAKAFGMKGDALEKFIATRYVDDKVGGFETKKKLCKAFKELQNRVFLRKDDDSWTGGDKELGDIFVAYACKAHRFMRETF